MAHPGTVRLRKRLSQHQKSQFISISHLSWKKLHARTWRRESRNREYRECHFPLHLVLCLTVRHNRPLRSFPLSLSLPRNLAYRLMSSIRYLKYLRHSCVRSSTSQNHGAPVRSRWRRSMRGKGVWAGDDALVSTYLTLECKGADGR
jgi:hypothetical protein